MRIWNAIISGVGGQGIMLMKRILENAALSEKLKGGKIRKMVGAEKHGLSQREGATDAYTRFLILEPDEEYDDLLLTSPTLFYGAADLAIGVEPVELLRNGMYLSEKTYIVINTRIIPPCAVISGAMEYPPIEIIIKAIRDISGSSHIFAINATSLALEEFGNALSTNMIILGLAFATESIPLKLETVKTVIKEIFPYPDENLKALDIGFQTGKNIFDKKL